MTLDITEPELAAIEHSVAFHVRATRKAEGVGYLIGRIDAGDNRIDQADDEDFAEFYVAHDGTRLTAAELFEQYANQLSERDDS